MIKRRKLLLSAGLAGTVGIVAACSNKATEKEELETIQGSDNGGDEAPTNANDTNAETDVLMNGALIFGPEDFYLTKIVVLDLGSRKSKEFYNEHVETLKNSYDNEFRGIGICLTDFSDMPEEAHGAVYSLNAASVAIAAFEENKELFWDYLSKVYEQLDNVDEGNSDSHEHSEDASGEHNHDEEEHADGEHGHSSVPDLDINDLTNLAIEVGLSENIKDRVSEPVVEMLVRNMTMVVENIVEEAPALLENRQISTENVDNAEAVEAWLLRDY